MKKRLLALAAIAALALAALAFAACETGPKGEFKVDKATVRLETVGETATVKAFKGDTEVTDVTWTVDKSGAVATVAGGVITAVATGTCTVTAKRGGESATVAVTVDLPQICAGSYVRSVQMGPTTTVLYYGAYVEFFSGGKIAFDISGAEVLFSYEGTYTKIAPTLEAEEGSITVTYKAYADGEGVGFNTDNTVLTMKLDAAGNITGFKPQIYGTSSMSQVGGDGITLVPISPSDNDAPAVSGTVAEVYAGSLVRTIQMGPNTTVLYYGAHVQFFNGGKVLFIIAGAEVIFTYEGTYTKTAPTLEEEEGSITITYKAYKNDDGLEFNDNSTVLTMKLDAAGNISGFKPQIYGSGPMAAMSAVGGDGIALVQIGPIA